ncbi:MAG TPA: hypothetical protein PLV92_22310, partial [Pirellulaceae bacterium]|nr:hypothetical protein [Pirellulaceae bacterium]
PDDIATAPNRTPVVPLPPDPQRAAGAPSSKTEPQAVLDAGDRTFVFVGEAFRSASEPAVWKPTRECWGANANLITKEGVDAAYVDSSHLVLIRRDEYVRYTRGADGRIPLTIDPGYPKKTKLPFSVDSALSLDFADGGGRMHFLFANGLYTRVKPSEELGDVASPVSQPWWRRDIVKLMLTGALPAASMGLPLDRWSTVQGHWENFPASLAYRFDAATTTSEGVRMFCGQDCWQFVPQSPPHEAANLRYEVSRLATSTANALHQALLSGGMPSLLSPETQEVDETPRLTLAATVTGDPAVQFDASFVNTTTLPTSDHLDFDGPNGRYYWEIFFHAPWLVAQHLNAAGKYEQAKRWFEFVFDPAGADTCWRFKPFNDDRDELSPTSAAWASQWKAYHDDPFDPFAIADLRRAAYRRAFAMAYVDNLLDWGDKLFAQFTQESLAEARMLYVLAYDLLGRRPATGSAMAAGPSRSYAQLLADGGAEAATPASSESSTLTPSSPETVAPPKWSRSPRA